MPMPTLVASHQKNAATKRAFQVKKNRAAMAPRWKSIMNEAVIQLISIVGRLLLF